MLKTPNPDGVVASCYKLTRGADNQVPLLYPKLESGLYVL